MSAKDEWKDPLTPKDLSLAEDVIDELQAEIDELVRILGWIIRSELDHKSIPIEAIRVAQVILEKHKGE